MVHDSSNVTETSVFGIQLTMVCKQTETSVFGIQHSGEDLTQLTAMAQIKHDLKMQVIMHATPELSS